jgi:hypothetical protein
MAMLSYGGEAQKDAGVPMTQRGQNWIDPSLIEKQRDWSPTAVLLNKDDGSSVPVKAMRGAYRFGRPPGRVAEIPCILFIDAQTRQVWAGRGWDFYVETGEGIFGIWDTGFGILRWHTSAIEKLKPGETLEVLLKRYDSERKYSNLLRPPDAGETDLRGMLNREFFNATPGSSNPGPVTFTDIALHDDTLEVQIESPTRAFHAQVWIDVKSKKVVKSVEDGDQVFPKQ